MERIERQVSIKGSATKLKPKIQLNISTQDQEKVKSPRGHQTK